MNLLSTFVFCVCVRVYVCGFYNYFFFSFVYCSVPSSSSSSVFFFHFYFRAFLFPLFSLLVFIFFFFSRHLVLLFFFVSFFALSCPIITRSLSLYSNFSLSLFLYLSIRQFALLDRSPPRFTSQFPAILFSLSVALFRLPPPFFRVTKIIRRHVRVRGIERYEEEGFEGLGGRRVAER